MYSDAVATARAHSAEKRHRSIRAATFFATLIEVSRSPYMSRLLGEREPPTVLQVLASSCNGSSSTTVRPEPRWGLEQLGMILGKIVKAIPPAPLCRAAARGRGLGRPQGTAHGHSLFAAEPVYRA